MAPNSNKNVNNQLLSDIKILKAKVLALETECEDLRKQLASKCENVSAVSSGTLATENRFVCLNLDVGDIEDLSVTEPVPKPKESNKKKQRVEGNRIQRGPVSKSKETFENVQVKPVSENSAEKDDSSTNEQLKGDVTVTLPSKRKILVVGDSQAQGLAYPLQTALPDDDVSVFERPGASLHQVLQMAQDVVSRNELEAEDWLVIIGGSCDVTFGEVCIGSSIIKKLSAQVKLAVSGIPNRYDLPATFQNVVEAGNADLILSVANTSAVYISLKDLHRHTVVQNSPKPGQNPFLEN